MGQAIKNIKKDYKTRSIIGGPKKVSKPLSFGHRDTTPRLDFEVLDSGYFVWKKETVSNNNES